MSYSGIPQTNVNHVKKKEDKLDWLDMQMNCPGMHIPIPKLIYVDENGNELYTKSII